MSNARVSRESVPGASSNTCSDDCRGGCDLLALDPAELVALPGGANRLVQRRAGHGAVLASAVGADGRPGLLLEAAALQQMAAQGVPVPTVHAADPHGQWLVTELIEVDEPRGPQYVAAALAVADRIAGCEPVRSPVAARAWSSGSRHKIRRAARVALGGLAPHRFLEARGAAAGLGDRTNAHGDFYHRNVLWSTSGGVKVIDWEFTGPAPAFTDHLRFWTTLPSKSDRETALEIILDGRTPAQERHIGVLARWLGLRLLAENLSAPVRDRTPADLAQARVAAALGSELFERTRYRTGAA